MLKRGLVLDIIYILLFIYLGVIYFSIAVSNIAMVLALLFFFIGIGMKKISFNWNKEDFINYLLIITPFILTVFSTVWSSNIGKGVEYLILRLPILLIPIIILTIKNKVENNKFGSYVFLLLTTIAVIWSTYNAFVVYSLVDELLNPYNANMITPIQHPYFGIYSLLALILMIEQKLYLNKIQFLFFIIILSLGVLLSTSRLVYLLAIVVASIYSFKFFTKRWAVAIIVSLVGLLSITVMSSKKLKIKITRTVEYNNSPRLMLWNNAYKVLKNSDTPLLGIGIGDFYSESKDPYYFRESEKGTIGYNPHNQYLEFIVTNGLMGFLFIFSMMLIGYKAVNGFFLYKIIFLIIAMFAFTESIFDRQFGVMLYSVFIPIIIINLKIDLNKTK